MLKNTKELNLKSKNNVWRVWTDADVEGRSTKQIGIVKGSIVDILLAFGDQQFYNLHLELSSQPVTLEKLPKRNKAYTNDIHFSLWGIIQRHNQEEMLKVFKEEFPKHKFKISNFYASLALEQN